MNHKAKASTKKPGKARGFFAKLLRYVKPYWPYAVGGGLCMLVFSLLGMVMPWVVKNVFDSVLVQRDLHLLKLVVSGLLALTIAQAVIGYAQALLLAYLGQRATADLRRDLYNSSLGLSMLYFERHMTGDMISRLGNDTGLVQGLLSGNLLGLVQQPATMIAALVMMFLLNWHLALLVMVFLPLVYLLTKLFGPRLQALSKRVQEHLGVLTSFVQETLSGIAVLKAYNLKTYASGRFERDNTEVVNRTMATIKLKALFGSLMGLVGGLPALVVLGFGGYLVIKGQLTPGAVIAFILYMEMAMGPVRWLANLYAEYRRTLAALERIFEILEAPPELCEPAGERRLPDLACDLHFRNVSFSYENEDWVLRNVTFDLPRGKTVAVVGPSGAGKSTLAKLLCRFYDPQEGDIFAGEIPLREVEVESLRSKLAYIPQESFLFGMTVRENLLLAKPDATERELQEACKAAAAYEFIEQLPKGLDTVVGERGIRLSGGQRQRLAIARALLRQPELLVMDEATASLHTEAEREIHAALKRLMQGRTCLLIAHRLSTVADADQIVVLEHGRVREVGPPAELVEKGGLFARMWKLQALNLDVEALAAQALALQETGRELVQ